MVFALTTAALVKQMKGVMGESQDALIATLIAEVSDEAETYLCRGTERRRRTDVLELPVNDRYLSLDAFPITGNVAVQYAPTRDFSNVESMDTSLYSVLSEEGQLHFHSLDEWYDPGFVRVVYDGGMAVSTDLFVLAYPRIATAVAREVLNRLNRAQTPEGNVQGGGMGQMVFQKPLEPLKDFYAALDHRRRIKP